MAKGGKKWEIMKPQLDYMMGPLIRNEMVIASGRSIGKCLESDQLVRMNTGEYVKLGSLIGKEFDVESFNEETRKFYWTKAIATDNGVKSTLKITLINGYNTTVTHEHPFLTQRGWIEAKDLRIDDYTVQPKCLPDHPYPNDEVSDEELKIIGYILADGSITGNGIRYSKQNPKAVNEMRNIVKKFDCLLKKDYKSQDRSRRGSYRISKISGKNNDLITLLKKVGLWGKNSHTKFIPDKYLKCSNKKLAILLNRLFTSDGWVDKRGVSLSMVSERLIDQIQLILLRYGIRANKSTKHVKYNGGINIAYTLNIAKTYLRTFFNEIGMFTKLTDDVTLLNEASFDLHKYEIPLTDTLRKQLEDDRKFTYKELESNQCRIRNEYMLLNEEKLKRYTILNGVEDKYRYLYDNIIWIKVKSIEDAGEHHTVAVEVPETNTHIINGVLSHNTSSIEHMIFMIAITQPKKWIGYIVRNQRHAVVLAQHLIDYFNKNEFTREMFMAYDKKDRVFTMRNGAKIEIRIVGHDKTGATTLVSGHYDFLFIDEAQLLLRKILDELLPSVKEGGKIIVAGVPNDIRDTVLYYYVTRKAALYYRYSSEESADWDEQKEQRAIEIYGGKHSSQYRNLVGGFWGDHASSVFRPSKIVDALVPNDSFRFKSFNGNVFEELVGQLNLPLLRHKYLFYIIGGDMGYTSTSPSHIVVWGAYFKKNSEGNEVQHYDVIYRLEVENMASLNTAKMLNYLMDYFNCKHVCIDAQSYGHQVWDHLVDKELYPHTYRRNKMYIYPAIFSRPMITGFIDTLDQTTGKDTREEIKVSEKVAATNKLAELFEDGRLHIAHEDSGAEDFVDLVTIMMAETQSATLRSLHPYTYSNSVNEHCFVGSTLIKTINGSIPIKDIKVGDLVLTRKGYKRVIDSWMTKKNAKVFGYKINDKYIECTPDHKFLINNEWKEISKLKTGDTITNSIIEEKVNQIEIHELETQDVYDITVEEEHEFFANDILVHNCVDGMRCAALVILQIIEKGFSRKAFSAGLGKPKRLGSNKFARKEPRRRHR
jgi:intein/homing endonuclease